MIHPRTYLSPKISSTPNLSQLSRGNAVLTISPPSSVVTSIQGSRAPSSMPKSTSIVRLELFLHQSGRLWMRSRGRAIWQIQIWIRPRHTHINTSPLPTRKVNQKAIPYFYNRQDKLSIDYWRDALMSRWSSWLGRDWARSKPQKPEKSSPVCQRSRSVTVEPPCTMISYSYSNTRPKVRSRGRGNPRCLLLGITSSRRIQPSM